ncbi:MAG: MOSC domain-containing protein [Micromonosporaceae bacterium]
MLERAGRLLSVNLAVTRMSTAEGVGVTGIDKQPTPGLVSVRAPGPRLTGLGSGLVGDRTLDMTHHGGDDQAVYAYAREDLDEWQRELGRDLPSGVFGENLTTEGVDVTAARVGERWLVGDEVLLQVTVPRIPCSTFAAWMVEQQWVKRFTVRAKPGTYLRVVQGGQIRAGQPIRVVHRPDHDVTVGLTFRALTREPELLEKLVDVEELPEHVRQKARRRIAGVPVE